jgi:cytidylate kinase
MKKNGLIIAIDGPSGAGKSTVAGLLADRLGYRQIDTGAMYRAVAWLINKSEIVLSDSAQLESFCAELDVRFAGTDGLERVIANGYDVTDFIRTPEMSLMTSRISAYKPVREAMVRSQRLMGQDGGVVLEGRDIGTVVFPDADLKFFLFASPEERGKRRFLELSAKGEKITLEETVADVVQRDEQDSQRKTGPLMQAEDAIPIDSSAVTAEEVIDRIEEICRITIAKSVAKR